MVSVRVMNTINVTTGENEVNFENLRALFPIKIFDVVTRKNISDCTLTKQSFRILPPSLIKGWFFWDLNSMFCYAPCFEKEIYIFIFLASSSE
jgi:hypothetical protein